MAVLIFPLRKSFLRVSLLHGIRQHYSTGIPRTFDAYKNEEKQPRFEATENFFYVTLPNLNYAQNDQINDQINELDLIILKEIHNNPGIKVLEILRNLTHDGNQVNENQIRNSIKRKIHGYIKYKGSKKTGGYFIKD